MTLTECLQRVSVRSVSVSAPARWSACSVAARLIDFDTDKLSGYPFLHDGSLADHHLGVLTYHGSPLNSRPNPFLHDAPADTTRDPTSPCRRNWTSFFLFLCNSLSVYDLYRIFSLRRQFRLLVDFPSLYFFRGPFVIWAQDWREWRAFPAEKRYFIVRPLPAHATFVYFFNQQKNLFPRRLFSPPCLVDYKKIIFLSFCG